MKEPQKRLRLFGYENRFKRFLVFKTGRDRTHSKASLKKGSRGDMEKSRQVFYLTSCEFTFFIDDI